MLELGEIRGVKVAAERTANGWRLWYLRESTGEWSQSPVLDLDILRELAYRELDRHESREKSKGERMGYSPPLPFDFSASAGSPPPHC